MKKIRTITILSAMIMALLMSACGGGGSDDSTASTNTGKSVTGVFIDAPVSGLGYKCTASSATGFTNIKGEFTCLDTQTVTFYMGDLRIGSALMGKVITPYSLYKNNENAAVNLARLLQTVDSDGNNSNGLSLNYPDSTSLYAQYYESVRHMVIDFASAEYDNIINGTVIGNNLVSYNIAKTHMDQSISGEDNTTTPPDNNVTNPIKPVTINPLENGNDNAVCNMLELANSESLVSPHELSETMDDDLNPSTFYYKTIAYEEFNNCQGKGIDIAEVTLGTGKISQDRLNSGMYDSYDSNTTLYWFFVGAYSETLDFSSDSLVFYIDTDEDNTTGTSVRGIGADYKVVFTDAASEKPAYDWNSTSESWTKRAAPIEITTSGNGTQISINNNNEIEYNDKYIYYSSTHNFFQNGKVVMSFAKIGADGNNTEVIDITDPKEINIF